jgi:hypothetical protein
MQNEICYICGKPAETRDHVPPKAIFPDPRPTDLITVPACEQCNHKFSLDDEYFRWFITTTNSEQPLVKQLVDKRVIRRFRKKPALLHHLMSQAIKVDIFSEGGIFLKQAPAFKYERSRIQKVIEKIVRGLYRHEQGYVLTNSYTVKKFILYPPPPNKQPPPPNEKLREAFLSLPLNTVSDGRVFAYRYWIAPQDVGISCWLLQFFERTLIMAMTDVKEK